MFLREVGIDEQILEYLTAYCTYTVVIKYVCGGGRG